MIKTKRHVNGNKGIGWIQVELEQKVGWNWTNESLKNIKKQIDFDLSRVPNACSTISMERRQVD